MHPIKAYDILSDDQRMIMQEKWIKHYSSHHSILLVGEGDFSFAVSLANAFGDASNMIATSFDSEDELREKYKYTAEANLQFLKSKGCTVLHDVDACTMNWNNNLYFKSFNRVVYNFPHAGFVGCEDNPIQISLHKDLVLGFFRSTSSILAINGEVHVTHKTYHPYSEWEIEELAEEAGLRLEARVDFSIGEYPGYTNRRGSGNRSIDTFRVGACCTYKFMDV